MSQQDVQAIQSALGRTRGYYLRHALVNVAMVVVFAVWLTPLDTTIDLIKLGCIALSSIVLLSSVRNLIRARKTGPMAVALVTPNEIAQVHGWPRWWKAPPGTYQAFLDIVTRRGDRGVLRVPDDIQVVVDAIHALSPEAQIAVVNVVPRARVQRSSAGGAP